MKFRPEYVSELSISPSGDILLWPEGEEVRRLTGDDLLRLLRETPEALSAPVAYVRRLAVVYIRHLVEEWGTYRVQELPTEAPVLEPGDLLSELPPVTGGEYWSAAAVQRIYALIFETVRLRQMLTPLQTLAEFCRTLHPGWEHWGKIIFHLTENKADATGNHPFAFMATYMDTTPEGREKHWPLAAALKFKRENQASFRQLVAPIEQLVDKCPFMAGLMRSQRIFRACAFTPQEAFSFLQEQTGYRQAGIQVRIFNIWKKKPLRPKLTIAVDSATGVRMNAAALLEFSVSAALGDSSLSMQELQSLVQAEGTLVQLRGEWVVADPEQIRSLLDHWQRAERTAERAGLTLMQGLRLLAGIDDTGREGLPAAVEDEVEYSCGHSLAQLLHPQVSEVSLPELPHGLGNILRPYQLDGVRFMYQVLSMGAGVCLADDMGLGKTLQTLTLMALWKTAGVLDSAPALLVVPATLIRNWQAESARFTPGLRVRVLHSSAMDAAEREAFKNDGATALRSCDLLLTTYGMLTRLDWLAEVEFAAVIADEAQAVKNAASARSRALRSLKSPRRIALTGTPVENNMGDFWSIFDFINPGLLGKSARFREFVRSLGEHYAPLRRLTAPFILRRLKSDRRIIADLPDRSELKLYCSLTARQAALYTRCVEQLREELENGDLPEIKRKGLVLAYLSRFKQICNHPAQFSGTGGYEAKLSGKFARLAELVETVAARQEKMLVFTQYREMCAPLQQFLTECFGRKGLVLHGGTPVKKRAELVEAFQCETGPPFFVISLKAGGTGLNLTAANHVVHFDRWWNPAVENQASDRAYRIGQSRNVLIHKFICTGTLEEKIDAIIDSKQAMADSLLSDGAEKLLTEMSNDELISFVSFAQNSIQPE